MAQNLSVLRRMALNLLKHEKTHKGGIEVKRCRAGWDEGYMETVLTEYVRRAIDLPALVLDLSAPFTDPGKERCTLLG